MTKVIECGCPNTFQDKIHGVGRRVCNKTAKQDSTFRCTVCGKEHTKGETKKAPAKK